MTRLLAAAIGAVLVFWMVGAYNRLVALRSAIGAAWAQLDEPLRHRQALLQALVEGLRGRLHEEEHALDALQGALLQMQAAIDAVRASPVAAPRTAALVTAEEVLSSATARVVALLEHHPVLRDGEPAVAEPLRGVHEAEARLPFGRQLFNEAAQAYNEAARQFPTRLLTQLYGFGTAGRL